jgi:hypothetical protein
MDELVLHTTLESFATWLHAQTPALAAAAGSSTGAPLRVHPPFQGPGPDGGVVLTFPPAVGGQPLDRGVYHAALTGRTTGPPPVLQIAVRPTATGIILHRLTATPAADALWDALLTALPAAWCPSDPSPAEDPGGVPPRP